MDFVLAHPECPELTRANVTPHAQPAARQDASSTAHHTTALTHAKSGNTKQRH